MCGFCGYTGNVENNEQVTNNMMEKIIYRGPDSSGTHIDEDIVLGFRRLSIIDLEEGSQPIYNEDKTKVIVFNGEIYNYQGIREELIEKGHKFSTKTDTEVILHGYEEYGPEILNKLRGMFGIAIWDMKDKELFIARDFFGIKPMYYTQVNNNLIFGSEIKSILTHSNVKKELNMKALQNYLSFQYGVPNDTFFKNILSCDITMTAPPNSAITFSSTSIVAISKWFVGSSKSRISGSSISALAKAALRHSPPDAFLGSILPSILSLSVKISAKYS